MLPVCIGSYLMSVLRYKFSILDSYHPDTLYLRERGCENPWLFFEAKGGPRAKQFGKHCSTGKFGCINSWKTVCSWRTCKFKTGCCMLPHSSSDI